MDLKTNNSKEFPQQGEVWLFDPDPVRGNEIGYKERPCLIISHNSLNAGPSELVVVIPCTSIDKHIYSHVCITPPDGGVKRKTFAMCEQVRAISKQRLIKKFGKVSDITLKRAHQWITDIVRY